MSASISTHLLHRETSMQLWEEAQSLVVARIRS